MQVVRKISKEAETEAKINGDVDRYDASVFHENSYTSHFSTSFFYRIFSTSSILCYFLYFFTLSHSTHIRSHFYPLTHIPLIPSPPPYLPSTLAISLYQFHQFRYNHSSSSHSPPPCTLSPRPVITFNPNFISLCLPPLHFSISSPLFQSHSLSKPTIASPNRRGRKPLSGGGGGGCVGVEAGGPGGGGLPITLISNEEGEALYMPSPAHKSSQFPGRPRTSWPI